MKTITVAGGNLYQLAAQYLQDATLWTLIASANNMSDPFFSGIVTLNIPDAPQ